MHSKEVEYLSTTKTSSIHSSAFVRALSKVCNQQWKLEAFDKVRAATLVNPRGMTLEWEALPPADEYPESLKAASFTKSMVTPTSLDADVPMPRRHIGVGRT